MILKIEMIVQVYIFEMFRILNRLQMGKNRKLRAKTFIEFIKLLSTKKVIDFYDLIHEFIERLIRYTLFISRIRSVEHNNKIQAFDKTQNFREYFTSR